MYERAKIKFDLIIKFGLLVKYILSKDNIPCDLLNNEIQSQ